MSSFYCHTNGPVRRNSRPGIAYPIPAFLAQCIAEPAFSMLSGRESLENQLPHRSTRLHRPLRWRLSEVEPAPRAVGRSRGPRRLLRWRVISFSWPVGNRTAIRWIRQPVRRIGWRHCSRNRSPSNSVCLGSSCFRGGGSSSGHREVLSGYWSRRHCQTSYGANLIQLFRAMWRWYRRIYRGMFDRLQRNTFGDARLLIAFV